MVSAMPDGNTTITRNEPERRAPRGLIANRNTPAKVVWRAKIIQATARGLGSMAKVMGISHTAIQRIWREACLKPHLVRTFKISNGPEFEEKVVDVIGPDIPPQMKAWLAKHTRFHLHFAPKSASSLSSRRSAFAAACSGALASWKTQSAIISTGTMQTRSRLSGPRPPLRSSQTSIAR